MDNMADGQYQLVYIAQERLRNARFLEAGSERSASNCWRWTKPTASASGATTSAQTMPGWGGSAAGWECPKRLP